MRRRTRTNLVLLALVALLVAGVAAELRRERTIASNPLTTIDPATVETLAIECRGCTARRFEKLGGHWTMRSPKYASADDHAVDRLLAILRAPVRLRRPASALDASRLGLDPPLATLTADDTVLKFGTTDAIRNDRYVETGGEIALVPDRFSALLFETPDNELAKPRTGP